MINDPEELTFRRASSEERQEVADQAIESSQYASFEELAVVKMAETLVKRDRLEKAVAILSDHISQHPNHHKSKAMLTLIRSDSAGPTL